MHCQCSMTNWILRIEKSLDLLAKTKNTTHGFSVQLSSALWCNVLVLLLLCRGFHPRGLLTSQRRHRYTTPPSLPSVHCQLLTRLRSCFLIGSRFVTNFSIGRLPKSTHEWNVLLILRHKVFTITKTELKLITMCIFTNFSLISSLVAWFRHFNFDKCGGR